MSTAVQCIIKTLSSFGNCLEIVWKLWGPAAKISATLFSADEIFEIFGKICSITFEIFEIFVVNWQNFGCQYSGFRHIFYLKTES